MLVTKSHCARDLAHLEIPDGFDANELHNVISSAWRG
jgi:hypothetical protein